MQISGVVPFVQGSGLDEKDIQRIWEVEEAPINRNSVYIDRKSGSGFKFTKLKVLIEAKNFKWGTAG